MRPTGCVSNDWTGDWTARRGGNSLGKLGRQDRAVPGAGELVKAAGGAVSDATGEAIQKKSKKCSMDLKTCFWFPH